VNNLKCPKTAEKQENTPRKFSILKPKGGIFLAEKAAFFSFP
jgi:hypothetical protein